MAIPNFLSGNFSALADEDLIELIGEGHPRALEVIAARHGALALSLAYRMCGRRNLAEDVVQDVLLFLWHGGGRYERARGSVRAWMLTLVHNRAVDAVRREALRAAPPAFDAAAGKHATADDETERTAQRVDDERRLRDALGQLPSEQRRVIELAYLDGLSHGEIAATLAIPTGTVKGRIRLGMQKLRFFLR